MGDRKRAKRVLASALCAVKVDRFLRHLNRGQLLTVMYHGVTRRRQGKIPWAQLPDDVFAEQVEFLAKHYTLVSLSDLVSCLQAERRLPERSALITFDDGLRNNLTVAFPILARFQAPAAIFVATDFIDSNRIYWFDELYLMVVEDPARERVRARLEESLGQDFKKLTPEQVYSLAVEHLKRVSDKELRGVMESLAAVTTIEFENSSEDYGVLGWAEIKELQGSGLVEFGVHTANHRILSSLEPSEWEKEIREPRLQMSRALGKEVVAFAYPNGRQGIDYSEVHKRYLFESGYLCAFSTEPRLARVDSDRALDIGRVPAGNDITSESRFFRLMSSGFPGLFRRN